MIFRTNFLTYWEFPVPRLITGGYMDGTHCIEIIAIEFVDFDIQKWLL